MQSSVRLQPSYLPLRLNKHGNFLVERSVTIQNIEMKLCSLSKFIVIVIFPLDVVINYAV